MSVMKKGDIVLFTKTFCDLCGKECDRVRFGVVYRVYRKVEK